MRYALVRNGIVKNIIIWDGITPCVEQQEGTLIQLQQKEFCDFGYTYNPNTNPRFTEPQEQ